MTSRVTRYCERCGHNVRGTPCAVLEHLDHCEPPMAVPDPCVAPAANETAIRGR